MIKIIKSEERGHTELDWLDSRHSFSFAGYVDPNNKGFRKLRVINDDKIAPGKGFGEHPHNDMEIVSYVVSGQLAHKDSMGNGSTITAGEIQRMSAGTGITHSEFNPSDTESTHLYQIWFFPKEKGTEPSYEQKRIEPEKNKGQWTAIATPDGRDGSVFINQDSSMFTTRLDSNQQISYTLAEERYGWLHVIDGTVELNGHTLANGDAARIEQENKLDLTARVDAHILLFDLN